MSNKETFETPASAFITMPETEKETEHQAQGTADTTETAGDYEALRNELINPKKKKEPAKETRSKHVQALLTPSLYKDVEKIAKKHRDSVNGIINKALMLYVLEQKQNEKRDK